VGEDNTFSLEVTLVQPLGDKMNLYLATERHPHLVALVDAFGGVSAGDKLPMAVDPQRIHFFAAGDVGERIAKHDGEGRDGLSN
jgi:ABC-type sugar transport system ATPase subunit